MQILVESDNNLKAGDLNEYVQSAVTAAVGHYADRVTRIEAHLGDNNSREKSGADDLRCMLEARLAGLKNVAVTHEAENIELAIDGAVDKLARALQSTLGKFEDRQRRAEATGQVSADIIADRPDPT